jgi:hypothetical protein
VAVIDLEHVTRLADLLSPEEQYRLISHLTRQLAGGAAAPPVNPPAPGAPPRSLRGIWRDHSPADADIDAVLHEIRHEWEQELDEVSEE